MAGASFFCCPAALLGPCTAVTVAVRVYPGVVYRVYTGVCTPLFPCFYSLKRPESTFSLLRTVLRSVLRRFLSLVIYYLRAVSVFQCVSAV